MKKIWLLLIVLLLPISVFAKGTCDSNNIKIQSISLENTRGNVEEVNDASINGQKIILNLKMNVIGDSAEYRLVLKNESEEDYYFDEKSINIDSNYVSYEVSYEDDSNIIKGGEEKQIYVKASYIEKVSTTSLNNGIYNDTQTIILDLTNKNGIEEILDNPLTGRYLGFIMLICMIVGFILLFKDKKKSSYLFLIVGLILPFTVNALCKHSMEIETNLVIDGKEAIFLPGSEVNVKMKQLAGDDTSIATNAHGFQDELITSVKYSDVEPSELNKDEKNVVSTSNSSYPIYMWFDNGTIYWWSEDKTPCLNENANYMFYNFLALTDISGIENFDLSNTESLASIFAYSNFSSLKALEKWNTSQVTTLHFFIAYNKALTNTEGIENWDVSKVTSTAYMFRSCFGLEEVDFRNWKTDSLTNMSGMLGMVRDNGSIDHDGSLKYFYLSELFNTSKVTSISSIFVGQDEIEDYSFLQYFDTSSVTNFNGVFINNSNLTDDTYFKDWDVTSADNFHVTFSGCDNLKKIDLSKWNPSNLTDTRYMFSYDDELEEIDISGLDTSHVTQFRGMFYSCKKLKHIYVGEKWDTSANTAITDGTFPTSCELPNFSRSNPNYTDLSYAHTGEGGYLTLKTN